MIYNKDQVRKVNDKKVLHKVGKNWKVVSLALLMAIGGGAAVAANNTANANADSTNSTPRTNLTMQSAGSDGVSSATQAEITSLETPPKANSARPVSASSASDVKTNTQSASASSSAVSYLSGDNGSAASYYSKANSESNVYTGYKNVVQSYVNSLNNQFPEQANTLTSNYNGAIFKQNSDRSAANQNSALAKQPETNSVVNSLASKAGLTASDYVSFVQASATSFSNAIQSGSALVNEMSTVNSDAQLIGNIDSNYATSTEYYINKVAADDHATVALDVLNNAKSIRQNLIEQDSADLQYAALYNSASVADQVAYIYSGLDTSYANSLAKSLGYANSNAINSTINSAAKGFSATGDNNAVNFTNASSSAVPVAANSGNMYRILSDTNAMQKFSHMKAVNNAPVSAEITSANNEVNKDQSVYDAASASASTADILGSHPTLANIFGTLKQKTITKHLNPSTAQSEENSLKAVIANDNKSAEQSAVAEAKQELLTNSDNDSIDSLNNSVQSQASSNVSKNLSNLYNKAHATWISAWDNSVTDAINAKFNDSRNAKFYHNASRRAHALKNLDKNVAATTANFFKKYGKIGALAQMPGKQKNNDYLAYAKASNNTSAAISAEFKKLVNSTNYKNAYNSALAAKAPSTASYNSEVSSLANSIMSATASDRAYNEASASSALSTVESEATNGYTVTSDTTSGGLLNRASYAAASEAINGETDAFQVASTNNSAISSLDNTEMQSATYSAANDEDKTLADYYAQSYSNDNLSDTEAVASAQSSLYDFYNAHTNMAFGNLVNRVNTVKQNLTDDSKLAEAYGIHVYNRAPKYITVAKNGLLHSDTHYGSKNDRALTKVTAGMTLKVLGVGFDVNGLMRYLVDVNGKEGFFTSNSDYAKRTYLPENDSITVKFTKNARIYKNKEFTRKTFTGNILRAGATLKNVRVFSMDNIYGGYTRIETPSGNFLTANTAYVKLVPQSAPKKSAQQQAPVQEAPAVYFN